MRSRSPATRFLGRLGDGGEAFAALLGGTDLHGPQQLGAALHVDPELSTSIPVWTGYP